MKMSSNTRFAQDTKNSKNPRCKGVDIAFEKLRALRDFVFKIEPSLAINLRSIASVACLSFLLNGCIAKPKEPTVNSIYQITTKTISGEEQSLSDYKGKVLLIVNTASKCGFTGQYDGLQKLYEKYEPQGLVVLGFPSNDFLRQEPGSNEEIQSFCRLNYGVTFPMFDKVSVKGKEQHPLYSFLTSKQTNPEFSGKISWNFNKFLIGRDGKIVNRFGSRVEPESKEMTEAIEKELATL